MANGGVGVSMGTRIGLSRFSVGTGATVVVVVGLGSMALFGNSYQLHLLNAALIAVVFAQGLNILMGYSGQISIGHAAFYGCGAYTSAVLSTRFDLNVWLCMIAGGVLAGVAGILVAAPALRIGSHYLAMVTIAVGEIALVLFQNLHSITGGYNGIRGIPRPELFGFVFKGQDRFLVVAAVFAIASTMLSSSLRSSLAGLRLRGIREDEVSMESVGERVGPLKLRAFAVSAMFSGVAGALYAHWIGYISPGSFSIQLSISVFVMVLVGGTGSVLGVSIGAILITLLPEYLRFTDQYWLMVYGVILLVFIIFLPSGLAGLLGRLTRAKG